MKYLKYRNQFLNEGFSASSLSKTLGWLNKSGLKYSSDKFLNDLKIFCEDQKISLGEISDKWFQTNVLRKKALLIKPEVDVNNPSGLWGVKFWFSAEEGYLGYSVTPKKSKEKKKNRSKERNEPFDDHDVELLLSNNNPEEIKTGELYPVKDYSILKTGDLVCLKTSSTGTPKWGKIFNSYDSDGYFKAGYFISNNCEGDTPYYMYDEDGSYLGEDFGRTSIFDNYKEGSWHIFSSLSNIADDHYKLHIYKLSDEPLHVFYDVKKEDEEELDVNSFNLSYSVGGYLERPESIDHLQMPDMDDWSIDDKKLKNSDFAIIFYLDEFLPHQEEDLGDIRKGRTKSREGATALMTDDDIKKINVEKRINYLIDKFDLDPSIKMDNMTNLNSILMKMFLDDFILFKVFYGYDTDIIKYLYRFFDHCQNLEGTSPEDFKNAVQPHINDIKRSYRSLLQRYSQINFFKENYDFILKSDNKYVVDLFKEFMIISKKLKDKIRSKNIVNLYDASIIIDRLHNIRRSETGNSRLSYYFDACIGNFISKENVLSFIDRIDENEFNISKKALKFIERQVDMI